MRHYTFARGVRADLRGIWRYIAIDNHSPDAANRLADRFGDVFALLAQQPLLGEARDDLAPGVRSFVVGSYLVLYSPTRTGVCVIQVVPAARDIAIAFRRP
jgi:toxin ParE1/3/4